jgi:hypothetical protein
MMLIQSENSHTVNLKFVEKQVYLMKDDLATCENLDEQVYAVFHFIP